MMESNGDSGGQGSDGWATDQQYQPHSTTVYVTSTAQQQAFNHSQDGIQTFAAGQLADSQFQLPSGTFQHVYPAVASTSGYERISAEDDFPSSSPGGDETLHQQLQRLTGPQGSHLIRVASVDQRTLTQPLVTVLLGGHTVAPAVPSAPTPGSSVVSLAHSGGSITLTPSTSAMGSAALVADTGRQQTLAQLASSTDAREEQVTQSAHQSLLQAVTTLPQLSQAESTTSEATAIVDQETDQAVSSISLALQAEVEQSSAAKGVSGVDSFPSEPDTTQTDNPPSYHQVAVHESSEGFAEASGSHLDNTLDSTMRDSGISHAGIDSTMDSTVDDTTLAASHRTLVSSHQVLTPTQQAILSSTHQVSLTATSQAMQLGSGHSILITPQQARAAGVDPTMDPSIDTSGISMATHPGSVERDLEQMLVTPGGMQAQHLQTGAMNTLESQENLIQSHSLVTSQTNDFYKNIRKSERIAHMERPLSPITRPRYKNKGYYNTDELWCEECQTSYFSGCSRHALQEIYDKVVLSRAWASLPPQLQIFRLGETTDLGVFAKKAIPKRTQFGPFIGELVENQEKVTAQSKRFPLSVEREQGQVWYMEASDENKCNWMMFVRAARSFSEQNLVAYQFGMDIYYCSIKNIEPRQELKVWYGASYAERLGTQVHEMNDEDMEALDNADMRWPCYECNKRFRSSAQLQKHLTVHDHDENLPDVDVEDLDDASVEQNKPDSTPATEDTQEKGAGVKGRAGKHSKKVKQEGTESTDSSLVSQNWKKKKTSIYINKYKKYHRDTIKKSIKSLYKKKGKESGGQEWVCTHCDLTFDNASLLNLHTLTHAAEDIGLQEIHRFTHGENGPVVPSGEGEPMGGGMELVGIVEGMENVVSLQHTNLECPVCKQLFESKRDLIQHASEHGKSKRRAINPSKPYKCNKCWKAFGVYERLQKHMLCHGDEESKPLQCLVCMKRFMNNSALACHLKTHSDKKYYECPMCHEGFDQVTAMKEHVVQHAVNGIYTCPECHKSFEDYNGIRKHMRAFHSEKQFPCPECDKIFPRPDKLKLHMLKHSNHREFMCETCGRQFKRKDKLKEHMKRMHGPGRDDRMAMRPTKANPSKKFVPKVSPSDYHRFIYKCHACLLGFKRRGMLVNHLAKRHPDVQPKDVPELNLPILKTQRDYYCQYCDKVYKSSSKRKAHIIKNHPGAELPLSTRKKGEFQEVTGLNNATYSQTVGSVTTVPHPCEFCHKQYASKAKLMQHQRKKHSSQLPHAGGERRRHSGIALQSKPGTTTTLLVTTQMPTEGATDNSEVMSQHVTPENLQAADLLTQAMSELTQGIGEFRPQVAEYRLTAAPGGGAVVQAATPQATTIELSHLGLVHTHIQPQQLAAITTPTTQTLVNPQTLVAVSATPGQSANITAVPVSLASAFLPRSWTTAATYQTFR